jgi:hypothetical protein
MCACGKRFTTSPQIFSIAIRLIFRKPFRSVLSQLSASPKLLWREVAMFIDVASQVVERRCIGTRKTNAVFVDRLS